MINFIITCLFLKWKHSVLFLAVTGVQLTNTIAELSEKRKHICNLKQSYICCRTHFFYIYIGETSLKFVNQVRTLPNRVWGCSKVLNINELNINELNENELNENINELKLGSCFTMMRKHQVFKSFQSDFCTWPVLIWEKRVRMKRRFKNPLKSFIFVTVNVNVGENFHVWTYPYQFWDLLGEKNLHLVFLFSLKSWWHLFVSKFKC